MVTAVLTVISGNHRHIIICLWLTRTKCPVWHHSILAKGGNPAILHRYDATITNALTQTATELIILACWGLIVISSTWHYILALLLQDGVNDKLTGCPTLEDLGVELTPLEVAARFYTKSYRPNRYYLDSIGEISHAVEPISASEIEASKKVYYWFSHWL